MRTDGKFIDDFHTLSDAPVLSTADGSNLDPTLDESAIHIAAMGDPVFRRLTRAMGQPDLAEQPDYVDAVSRSAHCDAPDEAIARRTQSLPLAQLERTLESAGVPATRIYTMADIFQAPHFRAREMLVPLAHETLGEVKVAGVVPKLSRTPGQLHTSGGAIGRDTKRLLGELARLGEEELRRLADTGVIGCAERAQS